MQPHLDESVYVNNLGDEGPGRVHAAYGENYPRLAAVKTNLRPGQRVPRQPERRAIHGHRRWRRMIAGGRQTEARLRGPRAAVCGPDGPVVWAGDDDDLGPRGVHTSRSSVPLPTKCTTSDEGTSGDSPHHGNGGGLRILVVGAGIAGLGAARALRQRGLAADVVERERVWTHTGAGIYLPGNAMRALRALGLESAVAERGSLITHQRICDHRGRLLADIDVAALWGDVGPCLALHRADLHEVLASHGDPVPARMGRTGATPQPARRHRDRRVRRRHRGQLRPGHRRRRHPLHGPPARHRRRRNVRPVGQLAWRFVTECPPEVTTWTVLLGRNVTFLAVPIGRDQVYCYCDTPTDRTPRLHGRRRDGKARRAAHRIRRPGAGDPRHARPRRRRARRPDRRGDARRVVTGIGAAHRGRRARDVTEHGRRRGDGPRRRFGTRRMRRRRWRRRPGSGEIPGSAPPTHPMGPRPDAPPGSHPQPASPPCATLSCADGDGTSSTPTIDRFSISPDAASARRRAKQHRPARRSVTSAPQSARLGIHGKNRVSEPLNTSTPIRRGLGITAGLDAGLARDLAVHCAASRVPLAVVQRRAGRSRPGDARPFRRCGHATRTRRRRPSPRPTSARPASPQTSTASGSTPPSSGSESGLASCARRSKSSSGPSPNCVSSCRRRLASSSPRCDRDCAASAAPSPTASCSTGCRPPTLRRRADGYTKEPTRQDAPHRSSPRTSVSPSAPARGSACATRRATTATSTRTTASTSRRSNVPPGSVGVAAPARPEMLDGLAPYHATLDLPIARVLAEHDAPSLRAHANAAAP